MPVLKERENHKSPPSIHFLVQLWLAVYTCFGTATSDTINPVCSSIVSILYEPYGPLLCMINVRSVGLLFQRGPRPCKTILLLVTIVSTIAILIPYSLTCLWWSLCKAATSLKQPASLAPDSTNTVESISVEQSPLYNGQLQQAHRRLS